MRQSSSIDIVRYNYLYITISHYQNNPSILTCNCYICLFDSNHQPDLQLYYSSSIIVVVYYQQVKA